jgi:hypothetical protein
LLNIDTSYGEGAGTADRLMEFDDLQQRINAINFGAKTEKTDRFGMIKFANVRACMWWNMRDMLNPDSEFNVCLPDDPMLIGDLVAPRRLIRSDGTILIEAKEEIKKRLGRSTDDGDACCLAFYLDHLETPISSYDMAAGGRW